MSTIASTENPRLFVLAASLRSHSLNKKLAEVAAKAAETSGAQVELAELAEFDAPLINEDLHESHGIPNGAENFAKRLERNDGFVIASPEYNVSIPGPLKNLIDWVSLRDSQPFSGKHGLLMSASPSMSGGNRGLWALRVPLEALGARIYPDMFSLAQANSAFSGTGELQLARQQRLAIIVDGFLDAVDATKSHVLRKAV